MKKKGFTLIELLAVIVILAIIALIAIPLIGNVIEKAKIGALENSVNGLVESANMYYANQSIKGEQAVETVFDFINGEQTSSQKLEYKGKVYNGKLILHANGEVAVCIDDKEHYAYKNKDNDEVVSGVGTCLYDGTTGDFSSNSSINDLRGKTVAATNITSSADGLRTLITIPEEGHYDTNSKISISNNDLNIYIDKKQLFAGNGTWTADKYYKTVWAYYGANTTSSGGSRVTISVTDIDTNNPMIVSTEISSSTSYSSSYDSGYAGMLNLVKISNVKPGDQIYCYANRNAGNNGIYYFGDYDFVNITDTVFPSDTQSSSKTYSLPKLNQAIIFYSNFGSSNFGSISHSFLNSRASFMNYSIYNDSGSNTRNQGIYLLENVQENDEISVYWYTNPAIRIYEMN